MSTSEQEALAKTICDTLLTNYPAIESGVSVVADGMGPSSDLLRLGGNGVPS